MRSPRRVIPDFAFESKSPKEIIDIEIRQGARNIDSPSHSYSSCMKIKKAATPRTPREDERMCQSEMKPEKLLTERQ